MNTVVKAEKRARSLSTWTMNEPFIRFYVSFDATSSRETAALLYSPIISGIFAG